MSYKSTHTGQQIDAGVDAALNPDTVPTAGSSALMTSGGTKSALSTFVRPNLLDNAYWVYGKAINGDYSNNGTFPINQRGQQSYTNLGYTIDRWREEYGRQGVTITQNGLLFGAYKWFTQPLEDSVGNSLVGKTLTATALFANGTLLTGTAVYDGETNIAYIDPDIYLNMTVEFNHHCFRIVNFAEANNVTVAAVKLELGDTQTLAHQENGVWVLNEIPNYQQELAKCQRYQIPLPDWAFFSGRVDNDGTAWIVVPTPVKMAKNPTISSGNGIIYLPTGIVSVTFGTTGQVLPNGVRFAASNIGVTNVCCTGGFSISGLILDANL